MDIGLFCVGLSCGGAQKRRKNKSGVASWRPEKNNQKLFLTKLLAKRFFARTKIIACI